MYSSHVRLVLSSSLHSASPTLRGLKSIRPVISCVHQLHHHHLHPHAHRHHHRCHRNAFTENVFIVSRAVNRRQLLSPRNLNRLLATQPTPVQSAETIPERLVQSLPRPLIPYAVLMRLTKPTGTWLLLWPCWWSIALSTSPGALPSATLLGLFGAGAVLLRSSGCIINDLWDQKIDASVERTKQRPIAAQQVSPLDAIILLHGLNACGLLVILQFDLNSILLALSSMALVIVYPACKRFTNWPQIVLGMAFNWGALLGWSAACNGTIDLAAVLPLYLGGICWTLIYDTLYAHQDKKDDIKLGLKSTAIKFGDRTSQYLYSFTALMASSLTLAGINTGQCWPYYLSVAACGANLLRIIRRTDINDVDQCGNAFKQNFHVGWMLFAGIVLSTLLKEKSNTETEQKVREENAHEDSTSGTIKEQNGGHGSSNGTCQLKSQQAMNISSNLANL